MSSTKISWQETEPSQRLAVFDKLHHIYESHGFPAGLKDPVSKSECVNILNAG